MEVDFFFFLHLLSQGHFISLSGVQVRLNTIDGFHCFTLEFGQSQLFVHLLTALIILESTLKTAVQLSFITISFNKCSA